MQTIDGPLSCSECGFLCSTCDDGDGDSVTFVDRLRAGNKSSYNYNRTYHYILKAYPLWQQLYRQLSLDHDFVLRSRPDEDNSFINGVYLEGYGQKAFVEDAYGYPGNGDSEGWLYGQELRNRRPESYRGSDEPATQRVLEKCTVPYSVLHGAINEIVPPPGGSSRGPVTTTTTHLVLSVTNDGKAASRRAKLCKSVLWFAVGVKRSVNRKKVNFKTRRLNTVYHGKLVASVRVRGARMDNLRSWPTLSGGGGATVGPFYQRSFPSPDWASVVKQRYFEPSAAATASSKRADETASMQLKASLVVTKTKRVPGGGSRPAPKALQSETDCKDDSGWVSRDGRLVPKPLHSEAVIKDDGVWVQEGGRPVPKPLASEVDVKDEGGWVQGGGRPVPKPLPTEVDVKDDGGWAPRDSRPPASVAKPLPSESEAKHDGSWVSEGVITVPKPFEVEIKDDGGWVPVGSKPQLREAADVEDDGGCREATKQTPKDAGNGTAEKTPGPEGDVVGGSSTLGVSSLSLCKDREEAGDGQLVETPDRSEHGASVMSVKHAGEVLCLTARNVLDTSETQLSIFSPGSKDVAHSFRTRLLKVRPRRCPDGDTDADDAGEANGLAVSLGRDGDGGENVVIICKISSKAQQADGGLPELASGAVDIETALGEVPADADEPAKVRNQGHRPQLKPSRAARAKYDAAAASSFIPVTNWKRRPHASPSLSKYRWIAPPRKDSQLLSPKNKQALGGVGQAADYRKVCKRAESVGRKTEAPCAAAGRGRGSLIKSATFTNSKLDTADRSYVMADGMKVVFGPNAVNTPCCRSREDAPLKSLCLDPSRKVSAQQERPWKAKEQQQQQQQQQPQLYTFGGPLPVVEHGVKAAKWTPAPPPAAAAYDDSLGPGPGPGPQDQEAQAYALKVDAPGACWRGGHHVPSWPDYDAYRFKQPVFYVPRKGNGLYPYLCRGSHFVGAFGDQEKQ